MIDLEVPKRFRRIVDQAHQAAAEVLRPVSRKYDLAEHSYPHELDMFAAIVDGLNASGEGSGAGAAGASRPRSETSDAAAATGSAVASMTLGGTSTGDTTGTTPGGGQGAAARAKAGRPSDTVPGGVRNGSNMSSVLSIMEMCWGDVGLLLSMPRQGLGNSAIAAVGTDEQRERFARTWAAMAITEPDCGSDSAAIRTTARREGDEYVINGEKIYVTSGERAGAIVVWATLDRAQGRGAIKSFVVEKGTPGMTVVGCEHKLGIRASDTATIHFDECRVPAANLLGSPEIQTDRGFAGVMQTFDNTRPLVAAMAVGLARAALERTQSLLAEAGITVDHERPALTQHAAAAALLAMEADWEAAYLLTMRAAWMADNGKPNSLQASMAKAKAGRMVVDVTLRCVELAGSLGYGECELLEKWARDAKILDIFEGTQQIQQLIVARRLLGKTSAELK